MTRRSQQVPKREAAKLFAVDPRFPTRASYDCFLAEQAELRALGCTPAEVEQVSGETATPEEP